MAQNQRFWGLFCDLIGRGDLKADLRFADPDGRYDNRDALTDELDAHLRRPFEHGGLDRSSGWPGALRTGPRRRRGAAEPFFLARGGVRKVPHPDRGDFKLVASPFRLEEPLPSRPGPRLGENTDDILAELGYREREIVALRESGVV